MKTSLRAAPLAAALLALAAPAHASEKLQAQAGEDGVVDTKRQCDVFVAGTAQSRSARPLKFRWRDGASVVSPWRDVRVDRSAPLDLCGLSVGAHVLTLEVADGERVATSSMTATIVTSPASAVRSAER